MINKKELSDEIFEISRLLKLYKNDIEYCQYSLQVAGTRIKRNGNINLTINELKEIIYKLRRCSEGIGYRKKDTRNVLDKIKKVKNDQT